LQTVRHFIVEGAVQDGASFSLPSSDAHHIRNVLRLKTGDEITVSSADGARFVCELTQVEKDGVTAKVLREIPAASRKGPSLTLAQALPKARKMDDIIRMACEIGVVKVIPVIAERSIAGRDMENASSKLDRWQAIALSAARQSQGSTVAQIAEPVNTRQLADTANETLRIVFWEEETKPLRSVLDSAPTPSSILVFIGPEGGLTRDEVDFLTSRGFLTASLGVTTLRTETAGIVALAAINHHYS
jgi:16S rRNA (uracil1498-N3)-methyltransferase